MQLVVHKGSVHVVLGALLWWQWWHRAGASSPQRHGSDTHPGMPLWAGQNESQCQCDSILSLFYSELEAST